MKNKLLILFYGLTSSIRVSLIGQISIAEIIAFAYFPFSGIRVEFRKNSTLKKIIIAYSILLLSIIISDIINESDSIDFLRGWASIFFSFLSFWFFVGQMRNNVRNCIFYLAGLMIIKFLWGDGDSEVNLALQDENTNYFKSRIVGFVNPSILLLSYGLCVNKKKMLALLILFLYATFCILMDARSNSLTFFIASGLLFLKFYKIKIRRKMIVFWAIFFISIGYIAYYYYVDQVLYHGFGGSNTQKQLALASNPHNPVELIYYGRHEVFISIEAIMDRPVVGYGSWGKVSEEQEVELSINQLDREYVKYDEKGFIPTHSVLSTAWLWGGILGFLAILYLFSLFIKMCIQVYKKNADMALLTVIVPVFIEAIWNFCFSPFGHLRTSIPFALALITVAYCRIHLRSEKQKVIHHNPQNNLT